MMLAILLIGLGVLGVAILLLPSVRGALSSGYAFLISNPGPFGVVFGRWTLLDV